MPLQVGKKIDRANAAQSRPHSVRAQRLDLGRGKFRVRGEILEIMPAYAESAYRISLFGDEIEGVQHFDP